MSDLANYIKQYTERGACTCGKCVDAPQHPEENQPKGHTADLYFFQVAKKDGADPEVLKNLVLAHKGEFNECNPLDGSEHSYIELGGWVGDQGLALMLMGLGNLLGLWDLMTPKNLPDLPKDLMDLMAGQGFVSIIPNGV